MKMITLMVSMMFVGQVFSCDHFPQELNYKSIGDIPKIAQELPNAGLQVDAKIRTLVNKVIELPSECKNTFIDARSFLLKSGKLVHLVYTTEDICDGGNSYGVVLDANLNTIASIEDSDFYCRK